MPPKAKSKAAILAAVGASLSKAKPSDAIRNPALDIVDAMEVDEGIFIAALLSFPDPAVGR